MKVRNKETNEVEFLRHGAAVDAVNAGTHVFVNEDEDGNVKEDGKAKASKKTTEAK